MDTHIVFWLALDPERISKNANAAIEQARASGEGIAISSVTFYELANVVTKGRVSVNRSLESFLKQVETLFVNKPITATIAMKATTLPENYPKDPMDRIIGATAIVEGLLLVTADARIQESKAVPVIW
ncbi:MAG: type II toxin-antitoxin system VapC family toxin [Acidobacteriaceae bacterium]